jgi:hypothetical protein
MSSILSDQSSYNPAMVSRRFYTLRLMLGEQVDTRQGAREDMLLLLETNMDDKNAKINSK